MPPPFPVEERGGRLWDPLGRRPSPDGGSPAVFFGRGGMGFEEPRGTQGPPLPPAAVEGLTLLQKDYTLYAISPPEEPRRTALDGFSPPGEGLRISRGPSSVDNLGEFAKLHGIDRGNSFFLGAHPGEIENSWRAGICGLHLLSGGGGGCLGSLHRDVPVFHTFSQAVDWILRDDDPLGALGQEILRGARTLKGGGVVAFPTETVYGLGADAFNPSAVEKIFRLKGRPLFNPLIVHLGSPDQVNLLANSVSPLARTLMEEFWPGPLTLIFPKKPEVPDLTTGGNPTVAMRMPGHPVALALIRQAGLTVAAPSANLSGRTSPTTAAHVLGQLGKGGYGIIDGGACRVGVESSVVSLVDPVPLLLRPGGISLEELEAVAGPVKWKENSAQKDTSFPSPGLLASHYAPKTPMRIVAKIPQRNPDPRVGIILLREGDCRSAGPVEILTTRGDLAEAAANLYAALQRLDGRNLREILAPRFPEFGIGLALNDRLRRAASGREVYRAPGRNLGESQRD